MCLQKIEVEHLWRIGAPAENREHVRRTGALSEGIVSALAEVRCSVPSEDRGGAPAEDIEHLKMMGGLSECIVSAPAEVRCSASSED